MRALSGRPCLRAMVARNHKFLSKQNSEQMKNLPCYFGALLIRFCCSSARAHTIQDGAAAQIDSAQYAKQLSSADPSSRRSAAEALARLVALDQKKLVEGYLLEEK